MAMARLVKGLVNRLGIGQLVADFFHDLKVDTRKTKEMAVTGAVLNGQALGLLQREKTWPSLAAAEFRVFSQTGEDGIIDWLVGQLPEGDRRFIEFGADMFR